MALTSRELRVLVVAASDDAALPVITELRRGGFAVERVGSSEAMRHALAHPWDVVISDDTVPGFGAIPALALVAEHALDLPFIMVTSSHELEHVVAALRAGAHDFLPTSAVARLPEVITREVREAALREQRRARDRARIEAERTAWVETLLSQIGHALNNPLAVLMLNLEILAEELARVEAHPLLEQTLEDARAGADSLRRAIRGLRPNRLTPPPTIDPRPVPAEVRGRVLVVDDELLLVRVVQRTLAMEHEVLIATHGRDAIDLIARGERFDVILCDIMMPEVTGMDVHDELVRLAPDQAAKMVFMTGGAPTACAQQFLTVVKNPCLEKPLDPPGLRAIVRTVIATALHVIE